MMRIKEENGEPEELDYSNAPSPDYSMEDLVKMIIVNNPRIDQGNSTMYRQFIHEVACKVRELEQQYKKLAKNLPTKLDDIFEPTINIHIGVHEITALCDLGASVLTIPKNLLDKLTLWPLKTTELRLHIADSTYKQAVGIKDNIVVEIKDVPLLLILLLRTCLKTPLVGKAL
jgi:uncharacterized UPF0146 family protein